MIKLNILLGLTVVLFFSCQSDNGTPSPLPTTARVTFNFTQNWDGSNLTVADFNDLKYTNANGEIFSIERLRYLISDITFERPNGEQIVIEDYQLVDLTRPESLSFAPSLDIPVADYTKIIITFGFDEVDNIDGAYLDLNSASWNVPSMLGGGYHYMQLEGKFTDNTATDIGYQYHAIRAIDITTSPQLTNQTFIEKNLGSINITSDTTIEIKMNIAEWFKNPNTWDLNVLHSMLMPNFAAQIMINENGQSVFSLGEVTQ